VRLKQVIRESKKSALRISDLIINIARNLHAGFHKIFPPEELPLRYESSRQERLKQAKREDISDDYC